MSKSPIFTRSSLWVLFCTFLDKDRKKRKKRKKKWWLLKYKKFPLLLTTRAFKLIKRLANLCESYPGKPRITSAKPWQPTIFNFYKLQVN